jgi:hypothetical protein
MRIRKAQKTYGSYGCGFGTLVHLHQSSKIKSQKRIYETVEIRVLLFLLDDGRIRNGDP